MITSTVEMKIQGKILSCFLTIHLLASSLAVDCDPSVKCYDRLEDQCTTPGIPIGSLGNPVIGMPADGIFQTTAQAQASGCYNLNYVLDLDQVNHRLTLAAFNAMKRFGISDRYCMRAISLDRTPAENVYRNALLYTETYSFYANEACKLKLTENDLDGSNAFLDVSTAADGVICYIIVTNDYNYAGALRIDYATASGVISKHNSALYVSKITTDISMEAYFVYYFEYQGEDYKGPKFFTKLGTAFNEFAGLENTPIFVMDTNCISSVPQIVEESVYDNLIENGVDTFINGCVLKESLQVTVDVKMYVSGSEEMEQYIGNITRLVTLLQQFSACRSIGINGIIASIQAEISSRNFTLGNIFPAIEMEIVPLLGKSNYVTGGKPETGEVFKIEVGGVRDNEESTAATVATTIISETSEHYNSTNQNSTESGNGETTEETSEGNSKEENNCNCEKTGWGFDQILVVSILGGIIAISAITACIVALCRAYRGRATIFSMEMK